ncbi:MAG: MBL fold metallo-hydrolase [Actinomycetota bacterium]
MGLGTHPYEPGLCDVGAGSYAWLQPDGGWGWSNAGLIVDGDEALLIDTLYDVPLTQAMLDGFAAALPDVTISTLVNTHSNGDHCNGNELLTDAEVLTSVVAAEEMTRENPAMMVGLLEHAPQMGIVGEFFLHCFGRFDFAGVDRPDPTATFSGETSRTVGDTVVDLVEVGPAHTGGDVLVHVADRRTVFTGDILFVEGHPILWAGTIPDLLTALDRIEAWQPETIVPGHGPVTDLAGVREIRSYYEYCHAEARRCFDDGMDLMTAADAIALDRWADWGEPERIVTLLDTCYREFEDRTDPTPMADLFGLMAQRWHTARS